MWVFVIAAIDTHIFVKRDFRRVIFKYLALFYDVFCSISVLLVSFCAFWVGKRTKSPVHFRCPIACVIKGGMKMKTLVPLLLTLHTQRVAMMSRSLFFVHARETETCRENCEHFNCYPDAPPPLRPPSRSGVSCPRFLSFSVTPCGG